MSRSLKTIEIINGPNLNLTGIRQPEIYGSTTMDEAIESLRKQFPDITIAYFQSNVEGELINEIQQAGYNCDAIIVNLGGYSHTSVALRDSLLSVPALKIEVHLSNIFAREEYRHHSFITSACQGIICGFGLDGYKLAIEYSLNNNC